MSKSNRFYTIMIVPEKTSQVRKFIVPSWIVRGATIGGLLLGTLTVVMALDYWYVMSQISENRDLKIENRKLRQQAQVFENKMSTLERTMDRVKTFSTRLKVITNIQDRGGLQTLNNNIPEAASNIGQVAQASAVQPTSGSEDSHSPPSPEDILLRREFEILDRRLSQASDDALQLETILQDQYELLADQKAFLAALPTRRPAIGYFTSGIGLRRSPFGGQEKMHEGLDIANHPGTPIHATADGTVSFANVRAGYGQTVIIDHGYGLETWYAHNRKIMVKSGQRVRRGDSIAQLGNSGRSTGPHLHYEVRVNGTPVNPLSYILEN